MDISTIKLEVLVDAGFATNKDLISQLGYILIVMDGEEKSNTLHYGSIKSRRIIRSVLVAELFAMAHGFDIAATMHLALNDTIEQNIPIKFYTDPRSLFDCFTNIS